MRVAGMGWVQDKKWLLRGPFGDVEIELDQASSDRGTRDDSVREVQSLIFGFKYREPAARRVVLEIYAALSGLPRHHVTQSPDLDFGLGSSQADALGDQLLWAAQGGRLVARKRKWPSRVVYRPEGAEMPVLGPEPSEEVSPSRSWIGLVLVDQDGAPVPGAPYRVVSTGGAVFDGQLDDAGTAMLGAVDPGPCRVSCPYREPRPAETHVVGAGEHISRIAAASGFDDYALVWNLPENANLRGQRPDPHVLQPGDALFIPERKDTPVSAPTGAQHTFSVRRSPLKLRLTLFDLGAKALAGVPVTVAGAALTTDGSGLVEATIDNGAQGVQAQTATDRLDLDIGTLNPPDDETDAGWKARLYNLGFLWDLTVDDGDDEITIALQDLQAQYGLPLSGQLDDATKAKLQQVYGA